MKLFKSKPKEFPKPSEDPARPCVHVTLIRSRTNGYECSRCKAGFTVEPRAVVAHGVPVLTGPNGTFVLATVSTFTDE